MINEQSGMRTIDIEVGEDKEWDVEAGYPIIGKIIAEGYNNISLLEFGTQ